MCQSTAVRSFLKFFFIVHFYHQDSSITFPYIVMRKSFHGEIFQCGVAVSATTRYEILKCLHEKYTKNFVCGATRQNEVGH